MVNSSEELVKTVRAKNPLFKDIPDKDICAIAFLHCTIEKRKTNKGMDKGGYGEMGSSIRAMETITQKEIKELSDILASRLQLCHK